MVVIRSNVGAPEVFLVAVPAVVASFNPGFDEIYRGFCAELFADPGGLFDLSCLFIPGLGGI